MSDEDHCTRIGPVTGGRATDETHGHTLRRVDRRRRIYACVRAIHLTPPSTRCCVAAFEDFDTGSPSRARVPIGTALCQPGPSAASARIQAGGYEEHQRCGTNDQRVGEQRTSREEGAGQRVTE